MDSTGLGGGGEPEQNSNSIMLKVVLPSGGDIETSRHSTTISPLIALGDVSRSGLRREEGALTNLRAESDSSGGGSVDRDRNQAQHVIDILEDVGMEFNGDGAGAITKIMEFEDRDRREMLAWEQKQLFQ
jgi:hypothetical protein